MSKYTMMLCKLFVLVLLCRLSESGERLMVVLLDGFRWDYVDKYTSTQQPGGFRRLEEEGVRAEFVNPAFPSVTYTNLYSILTGLHPESHGMIANNMYDERQDERFDFGFNPEQIHPHWWNGGEPIWVTAVKQGLAAYVYHWPGCEVEIRGYRPTHCTTYPGFPVDPQEARANFSRQWQEGLRVLQSDQAQLVLVYFELIDFWGHLYGPESPEVASLVTWMDDQFDQLLDDISERGLDLDLNLLVLSDHGMTDISPGRTVNPVSGALQEGDYVRVMDHGPVLSVWPSPGREQQVYRKLSDFSPHMSVYRKYELPSRWRMKNHFRVAPITCVAEPGWMILPPSAKVPGFREKPYLGYHGFDSANSRDMRAIMYAHGPNIQVGQKVEGVDNVHVYELMCALLQLDPAPNNGSRDLVMKIYTGNSGVPLPWSATILCGLILATFIVAVYMFRTFASRKRKLV